MVDVFGKRRHRRSDTGPTEGDVTLDNLLTLLANSRTATVADVERLPATVGLVGLFADVASSFDLVEVDRTGAAVDLQPMTLRRPDPTEEVSETVENIVESLAYTGNAYALIGDDAWPATTLRVVNPDLVDAVARVDDDRAVDYWLVNGARYHVDEVAHWKIFDDPRRGPLGRSPLREAAPYLAAYAAAYDYLAQYFTDGGIPASYLKLRRPGITDERVKAIRDDWVAARRTHRTGALPPDIDLEVPTAGGAETDNVLTVLEAASAELGRLFRVPPSLSNAAVAGYSLTYTNVADDVRRWLALGLGPTWLRAIERGFTRLIPAESATRCKVDTSTGWLGDLLAAETAAAQPATNPVEVAE